MRKWIFASLIFFCVQVKAYSLRCTEVANQETARSGALQNFNMYDIESPARTSSISGWQGLGTWQWGDSLVQWSYQNNDGTVITAQFAKSLFDGLLNHQIKSLEGDLYARAISPHGIAVRCEMLRL